MKASSVTIPRMTIWASALGTAALLCVAPFALPRISLPEMQTNIVKPVVTARPATRALLASKLPKPSAAHRKIVHTPAPETAALADASATPLNGQSAAGNESGQN